MADTISGIWESLVSNKRKRILFIADGDAPSLYYTGMLLQRLDYNIYTTRMAEEALEIMIFSIPLLVLTDVSLGRMDGIAFLKRIKEDPRIGLSFPLHLRTRRSGIPAWRTVAALF